MPVSPEHFIKADSAYGEGIAKGLDIDPADIR